MSYCKSPCPICGEQLSSAAGARASHLAKHKRPPNPLEKVIEQKVCDYAKSKGCLVYKFTSPSRRSVPDRMFIAPGVHVFFIEFKRRGEKPTAGQMVEIEKIKGKGGVVWVVDNVEDGKRIIDLETL
jgi:hypothetical protein